MIDAIGRKIMVGDFILYTINNYLSPGLVEVVNQRTIKYRWHSFSGNTSILKSYDHIIIVPEQEIERMLQELDDAIGSAIDNAEDIRYNFKLLWEYKQNNINKYER